jgi:HAD superfamily hydrolase (TIGR01490 family)
MSSAAFYDVDGTLIDANIVHVFAYYALNQPTIAGSVVKTLTTLASAPVLWAADKLSRKAFNEIFYRYYRGQSQDRLYVLAEEMFEDVIKPVIFPGTQDLIADSRRAGCRQVLVTGGIDFTVRPLAQFLGVDDVIANKLEFVNGYATGRLEKPFIAGAAKADILRDYARRHDIDLTRSYAYSDSYSDLAMLAAVGRPTAVNPDFRLRATARSYDWPVLSLS